ncbi:DUF2993 domain-containing protein [Kribbella sp. NPDC050281]|uniref:LmeA family phospholipid-binding protein n=1 Tax=Kribbella sp. NPDC050281 TaxID=3155515 RepID=UPI0033DE0EA0
MRSRGPGRWLRRLVVTVIVLGVLAVAVDRAAEWAAENRLATMAENQAANYDVEATDTSVEVGGFGFLPQLVKEKFSSVTLTMKQPTFSNDVAAEDLVVEMSGVHVPRALLEQKPGTAVTVDSTAMRVHLSPDELTKLAARTTNIKGLSFRIVDGKLHARLTVGGLNADVAVTPQVKGRRIALGVEDMSDSIPSVVRNAVKSQLARGLTFPQLPFDASLKQVSVEGDSLLLVAAVADLKLTS